MRAPGCRFPGARAKKFGVPGVYLFAGYAHKAAMPLTPLRPSRTPRRRSSAGQLPESSHAAGTASTPRATGGFLSPGLERCERPCVRDPAFATPPAPRWAPRRWAPADASPHRRLLSPKAAGSGASRCATPRLSPTQVPGSSATTSATLPLRSRLMIPSRLANSARVFAAEVSENSEDEQLEADVEEERRFAQLAALGLGLQRLDALGFRPSWAAAPLVSEASEDELGDFYSTPPAVQHQFQRDLEDAGPDDMEVSPSTSLAQGVKRCRLT
ncbi:unnamed protein product [Polarella glacialis]|uniref:Uncharacterized protein n=1 Tax=Polarella glacialis TaxID=89957 RepID=A0A813HMF0_POLGL|nr:unnamed protein product [Polarella glacialis]